MGFQPQDLGFVSTVTISILLTSALINIWTFAIVGRRVYLCLEPAMEGSILMPYHSA